jgi:hypothetical protein
MSDLVWRGRTPIEFDFDEEDLALVEEFWAKPYELTRSKAPAASEGTPVLQDP